MSSTLFAAKKSSFRDLADLLAAGKDFHNNGKTFTGEVWGRTELPAQGWMTDLDYTMMVRRTVLDKIEYVVRSYQTVIGYRVAGNWYVSAAKYSPTTSQHQSKFAAAVSVLNG